MGRLLLNLTTNFFCVGAVALSLSWLINTGTRYVWSYGGPFGLILYMVIVGALLLWRRK